MTETMNNYKTYPPVTNNVLVANAVHISGSRWRSYEALDPEQLEAFDDAITINGTMYDGPDQFFSYSKEYGEAEYLAIRAAQAAAEQKEGEA